MGKMTIRRPLPVLPLTLAVALFMENMDATVIATSLPAIAGDLGTEPIALKLALTAYYVALAIFIPLSGWMADRFGTRNVFRLAIAVFMAGSIACAFSDSLLAFVLARFLQGMGGSMMSPVARLVLARTTAKSELVNALAWLTIPALVGPLLGPPVGGFITTYLSWHWIFWINVPIGLIGIFAISRVFRADELRVDRPVDLWGLVLVATAFSGGLFGFSVIGLPAIPLEAGFVSIGVGFVAALLYLRHVRRTARPILEPGLFRNKVFATAIVTGSVFRVGNSAYTFLMPLMLQLGFGMSPLESGLTTFVTAFGAILSKFAASRVFRTFGFPLALTTAATLAVLILFGFALVTPDLPHIVLLFVLFVAGLARSIFFTGTNALVFADVAPEKQSQGTAINSVMQQLSTAAGVAVAAAALELSTALHGGGPLVLGDFHFGWLVLGAVSALSLIPLVRMPAGTASDVSGHVRRPPAEEA